MRDAGSGPSSWSLAHTTHCYCVTTNPQVTVPQKGMQYVYAAPKMKAIGLRPGDWCGLQTEPGRTIRRPGDVSSRQSHAMRPVDAEFPSCTNLVVTVPWSSWSHPQLRGWVNNYALGARRCRLQVASKESVSMRSQGILGGSMLCAGGCRNGCRRLVHTEFRRLEQR
jgi:hypothetical protein